MNEQKAQKIFTAGKTQYLFVHIHRMHNTKSIVLSTLSVFTLG